MRAKTILTVLFLVSIGVAAFAILHALPQRVDPEAQTSEILVAAVPLAAGTLLRAHDVIWHPFPGAADLDKSFDHRAGRAKPGPRSMKRRAPRSMAWHCAAPSCPAFRSAAAGSSGPAIATSCKSFCHRARGRSRSPSAPAGRVPASCTPGTVSTSC
jgi:hypothetical protein